MNVCCSIFSAKLRTSLDAWSSASIPPTATLE